MQESTDQNRLVPDRTGPGPAKFRNLGPDQDREKFSNLGPAWTRTGKILEISDRLGAGMRKSKWDSWRSVDS